MLTNLGKLHGVFTTGESQLPGDEYTRESRLPGDEYTGELIINSNNSLNIQKNYKSFLGVSNGTSRRCLMNKTKVKKSRDTVPLTLGEGGRELGCPLFAFFKYSPVIKNKNCL